MLAQWYNLHSLNSAQYRATSFCCFWVSTATPLLSINRSIYHCVITLIFRGIIHIGQPHYLGANRCWALTPFYLRHWLGSVGHNSRSRTAGPLFVNISTIGGRSHLFGHCTKGALQTTIEWKWNTWAVISHGQCFCYKYNQLTQDHWDNHSYMKWFYVLMGEVLEFVSIFKELWCSTCENMQNALKIKN